MKKLYRFTRLKIRKENLKNLLFNANETPLNKAKAVAIGVFIGVIPIWGIQVISAILSAQFLKVSKPLAILASHINITPLFPLIILFSIKIGSVITGNSEALPLLSEITFNTAKTYFWMFLIGSVPIAFITSLIFGSITYSAAVLINSKKVE